MQREQSYCTLPTDVDHEHTQPSDTNGTTPSQIKGTAHGSPSPSRGSRDRAGDIEHLLSLLEEHRKLDQQCTKNPTTYVEFCRSKSLAKLEEAHTDMSKKWNLTLPRPSHASCSKLSELIENKNEQDLVTKRPTEWLSEAEKKAICDHLNKTIVDRCCGDDYKPTVQWLLSHVTRWDDGRLWETDDLGLSWRDFLPKDGGNAKATVLADFHTYNLVCNPEFEESLRQFHPGHNPTASEVRPEWMNCLEAFLGWKNSMEQPQEPYSFREGTNGEESSGMADRSSRDRIRIQSVHEMLSRACEETSTKEPKSARLGEMEALARVCTFLA